ncbi:unnamed protein product [Rotaria sordida]|uniref:Sacsin/Nov domain-containing protein n=1 Tax=Rotaria sordida TaxID=392033 RepID=A0A819PX44_9BILA|nr:unnamed protein product [Rotaria sordida]
MKAQQGGNEGHVTINLRKLIEGMLAHYSSEFFVFRELIQNADDAKASSFSLEIKCNAPSSSSVEMDFHNHVITEICTTNDGLIFSETDWKRVATIAEGNTDIASVGRFGVGFYSVFSYTEEPIIVSGKEYMIFVWKDNNSLTTLRQQLPIKQQSKTTSIILKMQEKHVLQIESTLDKNRITNKDVPIINLTQLKAYFAKVTEQIFTIVDGPSMTLGRVDVEARLNIDQQFHNHVRRILNKSLPSIVQIQLLFVPIDVIIRHQQQLKSSEVVNDLNIQIFNSILPLKFVDEEIIPAGLIFIGLETHQSAGFGMHVSSHLITTLERENLDLQDPYIEKWNKELLTSIGQIARCIYDQIIIHSSNNIARERYNAVMAPYSFQTSVPNKEIGTIILNGFFASQNKILVPVKQFPSDPHLSFMSSTAAFLADSKHIQSFLSCPLVPFELSKNRFFIILKERGLINHVDKSIIENKLASSILLFIELIELLHWICSDDINDKRCTKRILSKVRFRETVNSPILFLGQPDYYGASHISEVLPLPVNVLPTNIARHFSQAQLENKLFLLPCTFKDLIDSYLHESQHYLLHDPKTAACLLSHFSKHSNQFSEFQWTQIKTILSANRCIPTTQGMKLPNDSYIPSLMLKPGLPVITLNLLPHKTIKYQTNNSNFDDDLISVEFLKQIGCRMLHIPSLIDNQQALDYQSMEILIENLIQERKNMSDTDFNVLKQTKFLIGTTLESTKKTVQKYVPQKLHFPFVAAQLNWSDLLIIDWQDIDPHSSAYVFLKELGVREVPELQSLINRIIQEHNSMKSRTDYEIPLSLEFLAKNFQIHYSTLWHTSNIQQPFLPSYLSKENIETNVILSAPDKVFIESSPLCTTLLPKVVTLFKSHFNILSMGVKAQPTLTQAFDVLMERKNELLTYKWACKIFAYLNKLDGLNQQFKERLRKIAFIPVQETTTLMKPSEVFIHSIIQNQTTGSTFDDINTGGLIDYVDFGPAANSFLINIGVRDFPSASILAELLIDRQANYFANLTGDNDDSCYSINSYINDIDSDDVEEDRVRGESGVSTENARNEGSIMN